MAPFRALAEADRRVAVELVAVGAGVLAVAHA